MTECWSEGELRAYLDGELRAEQSERLAAHLDECAGCSERLGDLDARAQWITGLMNDLPPLPAAQKPKRRGRWIAALTAAAAAGILVTLYLWGRPPGLQPAPWPAFDRSAAGRAAPERAPDQAIPAPPVTAAAAAIQPLEEPRVVRLPVRKRTAPRLRPEDTFVALTDEPFETGVVLRVALGPAQVPADIVFGSDGRARAIRLVSFNKDK
jgi:hypothetical protein